MRSKPFKFKIFDVKSDNFYPSLYEFLDQSHSKIILEDKNTGLSKSEIDRISLKNVSEATSPHTGNLINMNDVRQDMEIALNSIVGQEPLLAPMINNFIPIYTWHVKTMATDGIRLLVNPEWAGKLSFIGRIFVLIHELMHCILLHIPREKGYDNHDKFNQAADYEVNFLLLDTFDYFKKTVIDETHGLYEEKYGNMPVEEIYELMPTPPPEPPNGPGEGPGEPPKIEVGSKVRIKETNEKGIVTAINSDGTYDIDTDQLSESINMNNLLLESGNYKKQEIVLVLPPPSESRGGIPEPMKPGGDEWEFEDGSTDSGGSGEPIDILVPESYGPGAIISPELGKEIALESGYSEDEIGSDENTSEKWRNESKELFNRIEQKAASSGRGVGKGNALVNTLHKIHKGDVDWKQKLKQYAGKALSPEKQSRLGNKKHMNKPYIKHGLKNKYDALKQVIVLVDVSGSMSTKSIERIINEISNIVMSKRVRRIVVAFFDDGVDENSIQNVKAGNKAWVPTNVSGRGGTSFQIPLDWIKDKYNNRVSLCIMFTDGRAPMPKRPSYAHKFIWMIYNNLKFAEPFGKQINIGMDK